MLNLDNYILRRVKSIKETVRKALNPVLERLFAMVYHYTKRDSTSLRGNPTMAAKYKAIDIARWFLMRNQAAVQADGEDRMSLLKLLKLLYYAEGCSLALGRGDLFGDKIVAWEHGPVVEAVWRKYKGDPYNIPFGSDADHASVAKISAADKGFLENVYNVFGKYSAWGLRDMTHSEAPWIIATENGRIFNREIDRDEMKKYFKEHYVA